MGAAEHSTFGHGAGTSPQASFEESSYRLKAEEHEQRVQPPAKYVPSPKHDMAQGGWGAKNPIHSAEEGQHLLDTGYRHGKQIYNVTDDGVIIKFQPDNTPENGYHPYAVLQRRDIPSDVIDHLFRIKKSVKYSTISSSKVSRYETADWQYSRLCYPI